MVEQGNACLRVCQMLSDGYQPIYVFRFDGKTGNVFILAGENIQILVKQDGNWEFINET